MKRFLLKIITAIASMTVIMLGANVFAADADLDSTFNIWNSLNGWVRAVAVQSNWKMILWWDFTQYSSSSYNRIIRVDANWSVDTSFNVWAWFGWEVYAIAIDGNWNILVWWKFNSYSYNLQ